MCYVFNHPLILVFDHPLVLLKRNSSKSTILATEYCIYSPSVHWGKRGWNEWPAEMSVHRCQLRILLFKGPYPLKGITMLPP